MQQTSPTYIHTLTAAFASTLDEIPQDMCRHFAGECSSLLFIVEGCLTADQLALTSAFFFFFLSLDLRELDAVLSQSLTGITKRIEELTQRVEGGLASLGTQSAAETLTDAPNSSTADAGLATEEEVISMFQLLHEIADDTGRIKLGGEDKIRVASLAAEHVSEALVFDAGEQNGVAELIPTR